MRAELPGVPGRRICRVLGVSRLSIRPRKHGVVRARDPAVDEALARRIGELVRMYPAFGYRRIWARLRHREGILVNRKAVYRILRLRRWFLHQRVVTTRPRVRDWISRADRSDQRWAMDVTHTPCGRDGWAHLAAVIDCHDRQIVGYEFAPRGRAKEAERALEEACIRRLGTLRPVGATPVVRSDNGLFSRAGGSGGPAAATACARSSSRPTAQNRMGTSSASSGV